MNNNISNSNILSYDPDLGIYSRPITGQEGEGYSVPIIEEKYKSSTLEDFEYNLPSMSIRQLSQTKERIDRFVETTKNDLSGDERSLEYMGSNDKDIKEEISESNRDDIKGNSKLEVLVELEKVSNEIKDILDKVIICIYGKDLDADGAEEIDTAIVDRMTHYEQKGLYERINYFSLYYDAQISYLIREYSNRMTELAGDLMVIEDIKSSVLLNDSNTKLFKDKFIKLNNILDGDIYKEKNSGNDILTAINNIFVAKTDINMYMDTFSELFKYDDGQDVISEMNHESIYDLDELLDNLVKTILYSALSKNDIRSVISKKSQIRSFFTL